ncbi:hypothetical protein DLE01_30305 [Streptomyces sp. FT05W]|nr:hypothetical protein DLE01_30305 [Streptomyces sp. FT05W]
MWRSSRAVISRRQACRCSRKRKPAARNGHNGHGGGTTAPPGLWLEAFTQAVNGVPKDPGNDTDSDDAWDKGDEK